MAGYIVRIGTAPITWGSKKHSPVALLTRKAEFLALSIAAKEVVWIQRVLFEANLNQGASTVVYTDDAASIDWASSERPPPTRVKHNDVRVHFVRDLVHKGSLEACHVSSEKNVANILTKPC